VKAASPPPPFDPRDHAIARLENHVQLAKLKPVSDILPKNEVREPTLRERKKEKRENIKLAKETKKEKGTLTGNPAGYTCTSPNCKNYGKRFEGIPASWTCNGCLRKFSLLKKD